MLFIALHFYEILTLPFICTLVTIVYGINFQFYHQCDNNMLCKVNVNTDCVPANYMDNFSESIINLMKKKLKRYA